MATTPNHDLRRLLTATEWTHGAAARAINAVAAEDGMVLHTNRSSITHWLKGTSPNTRTVGWMVEAFARRLNRPVTASDLGYPDHLPGPATQTGHTLSNLLDQGRDDVNRRTLLSFSLAALSLPTADLHPLAESADRVSHGEAGYRLGISDVEAIASTVRSFDVLDERLGGGAGLEAVTSFLNRDVGLLYASAPPSGAVRDALLATAVELSFLAGWKHRDLMREGQAQNYYLMSLRLAKELGNPALIGYVKRIMAHQAFDIGHGADSGCLGLAESSLRRVTGHVDPHTQAVFTLTVARAHSCLGDKRRALDALRAAERLDERSRPGDERPDWPKMRNNRGQLHSHIAKTLLDLGDYAGAERHFEMAYRERNPVTHALISGLSQAWLAECQAMRGNIEAACANWTQARERLSGNTSERARQCWRDMRALLAPWRSRRIPGVESLLAGGTPA